MTVTVRSVDAEGRVARVVADGDAAEPRNLGRFRRALAAAAERHRGLVVDLLAVGDIPAAAVATLVETAAQLRWAGGDLAVAASGEVAERLALAGLTEALKVVDDPERACAALAVK